jgi:hypothetical protein
MAMSNGGIENHNGKVDTNHLVQRGIGNSALQLTYLDPELADGNHHVENSNSNTPDIRPSRETVHHVGKGNTANPNFLLAPACFRQKSSFTISVCLCVKVCVCLCALSRFMFSVIIEEDLQAVEEIFTTVLLNKGNSFKKNERIICFVRFLQTHGGRRDSI